MGQFQYEVVPSTALHVRPMSAKLRAAAAITLQGFGYRPREALRRAYVASRYCRTALMDGKPIAMWGVKGTMLDDVAFVWLVLSDEVTRFPLAVVKEAQAELAKIMETVDEVAITVLPDDEAAIRFACYLGFHDRDDLRMSRKELVRSIMEDPQYKIAIGDQFIIALGYHPDNPHREIH